MYADARLVALERRGFLETLAVMDALGIAPVSLPRYPVRLLAAAMRHMPAIMLNPVLRRKIAGGRGGKPPSLQLGLAQGNPRSEGEFLYGAVARAGAEAGIDTPVNRALWETLRAIASGAVAWDAYRGKPERLIEAVAAYKISFAIPTWRTCLGGMDHDILISRLVLAEQKRDARRKSTALPKAIRASTYTA